MAGTNWIVDTGGANSRVYHGRACQPHSGCGRGSVVWQVRLGPGRHRAGSRLYWKWLSRIRSTGERKPVNPQIRALIFRMVAENPTPTLTFGILYCFFIIGHDAASYIATSLVVPMHFGPHCNCTRLGNTAINRIAS